MRAREVEVGSDLSTRSTNPQTGFTVYYIDQRGQERFTDTGLRRFTHLTPWDAPHPARAYRHPTPSSRWRDECGIFLFRNVIFNEGFSFCVRAISAVGFPTARVSRLLIPRNIEVLGQECFSATEISYLSFEADSRLTLIDIEALAFGSGLRSIAIPASVEILSLSCFFQSDSLRVVEFALNSRLSIIEEEVFAECSSIFCIRIPASVEIIGRRCFADCRSLAYFECGIGSRLSQLDAEAFLKCPSLRSVDLPRTIQIVGRKCFMNCPLLRSVTFEDDCELRTIGSESFSHCASLECIVLPRFVEFLPFDCFRDCRSLTSVIFELDCRLRRIESGAFRNCSAIHRVHLPRSVEVVCSEAFSACSALFTVEIANNSKLIRIECDAFFNCFSLASFSGPLLLGRAVRQHLFSDAWISWDSVCDSTAGRRFCAASRDPRIQSFRTRYSRSDTTVPLEFIEPLSPRHRHLMLRNVVYDRGLCWENVKIDAGGFAGTHLIGVCIPRNVEILDDESFANANIKFLVFEAHSHLGLVKDSAFAFMPWMTSLSVPADHLCILQQVFESCSRLSAFSFGDRSRVTEFHGSLFKRCMSLEVVIVPASVEILCERCFYSCKALRVVEFEAPSKLRIIEAEAFMECSSLLSISIPASVEGVHKACFSGCRSLVTVTFEAPSRLRKLGRYLFAL
jgi:hypothetical protein